MTAPTLGAANPHKASEPRLRVLALGDGAGSSRLTITDANAHAAEFLGFTEEELKGRSLADAFPAIGTPAELAALRLVLETGQPLEQQQTRLRAGAGLLALDVHAVQDGEGLTLSWPDVHHRAPVDQQVSEQLFRAIAENSSDIIFLADVEGRIQWLSPMFTPALGWAPQAWLGRTLTEYLHPDDQSTLAGTAERLLAGEVVRTRLRLMHDDGEYRWFQAGISALQDTEGTVIGQSGSLRDIAAEVRWEADLLESEQHYRLLAENASDVVFLAGPDLRISWISPTVERVLGWRPDEVVGRIMAELVHPDDRGETAAARGALFAGTSDALPPGFTLRVIAKDGTTRWMAGRGARVENPAGEFIGMVCGLRDVTDLMEAQKHADESRARLAAMQDALMDPHVVLQAIRDDAGAIVDLVYVEANAAALSYLRNPDLVGVHLFDQLPGLRGSGLFEQYAAVVDSGQPLVLDDWSYPNEVLASERRYDIRGIKLDEGLSFTWRDVTERYEAARATARSEEHYRLLADNSTDAVVHTRGGIVQWASPSLQRTLGWEPADWVGHDFQEFVHPDDLEQLLRRWAHLGSSGNMVSRSRVRDSGGEFHWVETHASVFRNADGSPDGGVASFRIIDTEIEAEAELHRLARYDELTEVFNRAEAIRRVGKILRKQRRIENGLALAFCDLDGFKTINDEAGHGVGDETLRLVAARLASTVRAGDLVARLGGDEFVVVLDGVPTATEAMRVGEKLCEAVRQPVPAGSRARALTLSVGIALAQRDDSTDSLIARADDAMYAAKARGKNQVVVAKGADVPDAGGRQDA